MTPHKRLRCDEVLASKCGIHVQGDPGPESPGRYDFRAYYILSCVEGSLRRLGVEQLDLLMLHRPDYLMQAHEVAATFDKLHASGKVAYFGVSNFDTPLMTQSEKIPAGRRVVAACLMVAGVVAIAMG